MSSSSSSSFQKVSTSWQNKYVFTCPVSEVEKLEPFFQEHLNYIQYQIKTNQIEGFVIRNRKTTKTKMLAFGIHQLALTTYKDDPFKMYQERRRLQTIISFGEFPPKHTKPLDKNKEVVTRSLRKDEKELIEYKARQEKAKKTREKDEWI